ncbi:MAG: hypothetical protein WCQ47_05330 [bacterium]
MRLIIIMAAILFSSNGYSDTSPERCRMSIKETADGNNKDEAFSNLVMKKWLPNTDRLVFKKDKANKNNIVDVSYDLDGTIYTETDDVKIPSKKVTGLDKEYAIFVNSLKKEKALTFGTSNNKQLTINLEKDTRCSKEDAAVMLFFIEKWFYRN